MTYVTRSTSHTCMSHVTHETSRPRAPSLLVPPIGMYESPLKSTKSTNSNSSVQIQIKTKSQFECVPRHTVESEFLDLVDFGGVAFLSGNCHTHTNAPCHIYDLYTNGYVSVMKHATHMNASRHACMSHEAWYTHECSTSRMYES